MSDDSKRKRRRKRWEEWQRELARRRERRSDPAGKVALQLLALFAALLALAPPVPELVSRFSSRRSRWEPPPGYPNGRSAWARERGLDPEPEEAPATPTPSFRPQPQPRPLPNCSWSRLIKDLNRRPTRERARQMIEERVPEEAHGWLRAAIEAEDWQTLRGLGRDADAETIRERAMTIVKVAPVLEPDADSKNDVAPTLAG